MLKQEGNSLLEIIIALSIFALIISAIGSLSFSGQFLSQNSSASMNALIKAKSLLENSKTTLTTDFYANASSSRIDGIYTEDLSVIDIDNFTREIKSTVGWKEHSKNLYVQLTGFVANWQEAYGADDCYLDGKENWQTPQMSGTVDLGYGNVATGLKVRGKFAFLTSNNIDPRNTNADKNDFFIVDVSSPSSPVIIFKADTGPGLSSIAVAGNYAYLGNTSINGQLQIFDIADIHNPILKSSYKLPGQYDDETTIPSSLFYNKGRIYLGTAKSQIQEFHVIDVGEPSHPEEIGKWEVNTAVNAIYVNGNYAYLATPNSEELSVLDISDPANITKVGGFDAPGGSGNGKSLGKVGKTLYLGRTVGKNELFALDITNPLDVKSLGSKAISNSINALAVFGSIIFLGTNNKFQILDAKVPSNIQNISSIDMAGKVTGIVCSGKDIYLSLQTSGGLRVIKSNPGL